MNNVYESDYLTIQVGADEPFIPWQQQNSKINPRKTQLQMANKMSEWEHIESKKFTDNYGREFVIRGNVGSMNNYTGWGKTVATIALIASHPLPRPHGILFPYSSSCFVQTTVTPNTSPRYPHTLILVPHGLMSQWKREFQNTSPITNLRVISTKKHIQDYKINEYEPGSVVLISNTMFKEFIKREPICELHWARFICDELHTCDKLGSDIVSADYIWSLNATPQKVYSHNSTITRLLFSPLKGIAHGYFASVLSTSQEALDMESKLPELARWFIKCQSVVRLQNGIRQL